MINKDFFEGPVGDYCIARNTIKCLFFLTLLISYFVPYFESLLYTHVDQIWKSTVQILVKPGNKVKIERKYFSTW